MNKMNWRTRYIFIFAILLPLISSAFVFLSGEGIGICLLIFMSIAVPNYCILRICEDEFHGK